MTTAIISPDGTRRPATLRDLAKLYDCLEYVDITFSGVFPTDIPEATHHVHAYLAKLENTDKVAFYGYYARRRVAAQDLIRMASVVAGGLEELRGIIENDLAGMVSRILDGITVSDETLARDVIAAVGPGGPFLSQEHTRRLFQTEHFIPKLSDRRSPESWAKAGAKEIRLAALDRVRQILKEHHPAPLDRTIKEELLKIIKDVEKRELANA